MEVRDDDCRLLGHLPGVAPSGHRVPTLTFEMPRKYGDPMRKLIQLHVAPFQDEQGRRYLALKSNGIPVETLRKIAGWQDA